MEVIKERMKQREKVIEAVRRWVKGMQFTVTAVIIGSYARGDFNVWSDVDVLLISDYFLGNPIERLKHIDPPPGVEVIPLRIDEFRRLREKGDPIAVEADTIGIIVRDDLRIFSYR
jgi:predicted nucleotidyltransferase